MSKLRVGVLRGGPSSEYDISLKTGGAVLQNLDIEQFIPLDVLIDREGVWHNRGVQVSVPTMMRHMDVAFNAMHGEYGEDGTIQKVLSMHNMPFTGSGTLASAVCMNKFMTKRHLEPYAEALGLRLARHEVVQSNAIEGASLGKLFDTFAPVAVVKPLTCGSSVGVTIARTSQEFKEGVIRAMTFAPRVLVEEYIEGREATCGVLEDFRGQDIYPLLPIEIIPPSKSDFFDYEAKYGGESQEICPGNFSPRIKKDIEYFAREVHRLLGLKHYSRSDFIVSPRGIYFLEVNTLPGLTPESLVPKALKAVGCSFKEFLSHLIHLATRRS